MFEKLSPKEKELVKEFIRLNGKDHSYEIMAKKFGNTKNYIQTKFNHSIFIKYQVTNKKDLLKKLLVENAAKQFLK